MNAAFSSDFQIGHEGLNPFIRCDVNTKDRVKLARKVGALKSNGVYNGGLYMAGEPGLEITSSGFPVGVLDPTNSMWVTKKGYQKIGLHGGMYGLRLQKPDGEFLQFDLGMLNQAAFIDEGTKSDSSQICMLTWNDILKSCDQLHCVRGVAPAGTAAAKCDVSSSKQGSGPRVGVQKFTSAQSGAAVSCQ
jgi:hypothetical protein